jgi:hypothetical protein
MGSSGYIVRVILSIFYIIYLQSASKILGVSFTEANRYPIVYTVLLLIIIFCGFSEPIIPSNFFNPGMMTG